MNEENRNKTEGSRTNTYSRRRFMQVASLTAGGALLAACNQSTPPQRLHTLPTVAPAAVTATAQASIGKTYFPSPAPGVPDAYTVPLPAFQSVSTVPGHGGTVTVFSITYAPPEIPHDMNRYWQELERRLNVSWNVNHALGN